MLTDLLWTAVYQNINGNKYSDKSYLSVIASGELDYYFKAVSFSTAGEHKWQLILVCIQLWAEVEVLETFSFFISYPKQIRPAFPLNRFHRREPRLD